jgi:hypothetical protein
MLVISYQTGGGHGEHEAIEEGLTSMIENPDNSTRFKIEESGYLDEKETQELKQRIQRRNYISQRVNIVTKRMQKRLGKGWRKVVDTRGSKR